MASPVLVPIVMGHNAFFGVDHLSSSRGAAKAASFSDPARILNIVRAGFDQGAEGLMMSTHERAGPLCDLIRRDPRFTTGLSIYPLVPYVQKYVTRANEMGMANVVLDALKGTSMSDKLALLWQGGKGVLARDIDGVLASLIRLELKPFRDLRVPAVFLHDAFTDLALGLGLKDIFAFYLEEIARSHGAQGAFATKNLPLLLDRFAGWGLPQPIVMTHVNKLGFGMNPSREACERALARCQAQVMAMGTLASGHLRPEEAFAYLATVPRINSIVVGVSSPVHIAETFAAMRRHGIAPQRIDPAAATATAG
jgi:hypothetical protein